MLESQESADVYDSVYAAEQPELFFKSAAWRVRGPGHAVSVRADSGVDVPEPELAAVLNYTGEVVGYRVCNDMSSRSIEGQNPLYLPQAKIHPVGCALGPWIRPAWEVPDPYSLTMEMAITRDGAVAWEGQSSTSGLRRRIDELADYLFREEEFPAGVVLSTGLASSPICRSPCSPAMRSGSVSPRSASSSTRWSGARRRWPERPAGARCAPESPGPGVTRTRRPCAEVTQHGEHAPVACVARAEACVDVAQHICAAEGWGPPADNGDAVRLLGEHGVLTTELAVSMLIGDRVDGARPCGARRRK